MYLKKIGKRQTDKCDCGQLGDVIHFIFGSCPLMPHRFSFNNALTVRQNLQNILLNDGNYSRLKDNYNKLNELYSFIRYKF